jgi:hypothetical protein
MTASTGTMKVGQTATITITSSKTVTAPILYPNNSARLIYYGGTIDSITPSTGTVFTASITRTGDGFPGSNVTFVEFQQDGAFDLVGNSGPASPVRSVFQNYVYTPPTMTITASPDQLYSKTNSTITFTANEPIFGFDISDVSVYGGTLSDFTQVSSTVYTVKFYPLSSYVYGYGRVSVTGTKFYDIDNTYNTATASKDIFYGAPWA